MELDKESDNSAPPCCGSGDELIFNDDCFLSGKKRKNVCSEFTLRACKKKRLNLHEDIICAILVKLPSKSVIRFKSACKWWKSLISDPYFIKLFYQQQLKMKEEQPLGSGMIIAKQVIMSNRIRFYMIEQDSSLSMKFLFEYHFPGLLITRYSICSHFQFCDGLLLLELETRVFVCNLTTRELIHIPDTSNPNNLVYKQLSGRGSCGLGFDRSTKRYKIVRYFYRYIDFKKQSYSLGLEVFTLGLSNTWRQIAEDPPYPVSDVLPASAEGAVYWQVWNNLLTSSPPPWHSWNKLPTSSQSPILRFDLSDEKFQVIHPPPASFNITSCLVSSLLGNLFYLNFSPSTEPGCVWMLNQEGKWTPTCKLNLDLTPRGLILLTFHRQNLLFVEDNVLYAYNFETESSSKLCDVSKTPDDEQFIKFLPEESVLTITGYVENILPIDVCRW